VFQYERELISKCKELRMNGVIRGIDYGELDIDEKNNPLFYLILELADSDLRKQTEINNRLDLAFLMRTLHCTAVGLKQLHWAGIAHQGIKPSNILVFDNGESKISDLGHAWAKGAPRPDMIKPLLVIPRTPHPSSCTIIHRQIGQKDVLLQICIIWVV